MKKLLLIPALCLVCFACNRDEFPSNMNKDRSQESSADWAITTKVKSAIMADSAISASARFVSVCTKDGIVTLTGTVPSGEDGDRIVKIAKNVTGVQGVNNQMVISK